MRYDWKTRWDIIEKNAICSESCRRVIYIDIGFRYPNEKYQTFEIHEDKNETFRDITLKI